MTESNLEFISIDVTTEDILNYKRLDQFLCEKIEGKSRTLIKSLFSQGKITASDDSQIELKRMPKSSVTITVEIPPPLPSSALPENIPLDIIFEDEHLIFVNKPAGMVVHPAPGNYTGTLVNAILHHCPDLQAIGDTKRPGIVHRLDKGTTGVMVVAKNQECHKGLVDLFSAHDIERVYETIVLGHNVQKSGTLTGPIGRHPSNRLKMSCPNTKGKEATTYYSIIKEYDKITHLQMKLETGRTHQIRVHLASLLNRHVLNDSLYGNSKQDVIRLGPKLGPIIADYEHPLLHAKVLGFIHPITQEKIRFEVPLPKVFQDLLDEAEID